MANSRVLCIAWQDQKQQQQPARIKDIELFSPLRNEKVLRDIEMAYLDLAITQGKNELQHHIVPHKPYYFYMSVKNEKIKWNSEQPNGLSLCLQH